MKDGPRGGALMVLTPAPPPSPAPDDVWSAPQYTWRLLHARHSTCVSKWRLRIQSLPGLPVRPLCRLGAAVCTEGWRGGGGGAQLSRRRRARSMACNPFRADSDHCLSPERLALVWAAGRTLSPSLHFWLTALCAPQPARVPTAPKPRRRLGHCGVQQHRFALLGLASIRLTPPGAAAAVALTTRVVDSFRAISWKIWLMLTEVFADVSKYRMPISLAYACVASTLTRR